MRSLLRRWLGVELLEASSTKFVGEALGRLGKVEPRLDKLDGFISDIHESTHDGVGPPEIMRPLACPSGHTALTQVVALVEVEAEAPEITRVVGGGFYCPRCRRSFYTDGRVRWSTDEAITQPTEEQVPVAAQAQERRARVISRKGSGY